MMRSMVEESTRLVSWSVERRVPRRVRPSVVRMRTFSAGGRPGGVCQCGFDLGVVGEGESGGGEVLLT